MRVRIIKVSGYYNVEKWRYWWPFWTYYYLTSDLDRARQIAKDLKHPTIEEIQ